MTHPLRSYVKSKGLTQDQFAKALGVRPATVSAWVNGTTPRPDQMARIDEITGGEIPVTTWFDLKGAAA